MIKYPVFEKELESLRKNSLLRGLRDRSSPQGARIAIGGRRYLNFASNDYLGLAAHPRLLDAAAAAMQRFGAGAGASRLLAGGCPLHDELEAALARLKGTEGALLFNSGYSANTGILPALARADDTIISDELNHASIIDGCRLSGAETLVYRHRDVDHLAELLKTARGRTKIVATDAVFSMDGDIAPLKEIFGICQEHGALLYLDEAHATGVLGGGRGALAHFGLSPGPRVVLMGTLSKALGSFGAFAAAEANTVKWLLNSARSFVFSTALPPAPVAAALEALRVLAEGGGLLERLWENRRILKASLEGLGLDTGGSETPILPVLLRDTGEALALSERLFEGGIYAPAIRPPTVRRPRLRLTVTAAHSREDMERLVHALGAA
jgi:8-amino-7-oxononanoate synthase